MYQNQTVIGLTDASKQPDLTQCIWPADALNTIPDWVYTSRALKYYHTRRSPGAAWPPKID